MSDHKIMTNDDEFRIYVMRYEDRNEWLAKARSGDEVAKVCQWGASKWMKDFRNGEHSVCGCCESMLSRADTPRAFVVLVPVKEDPEKVSVKVLGVCAECSKHENRWLVDQGVRREGLSPTTARAGDQLH